MTSFARFYSGLAASRGLPDGVLAVLPGFAVILIVGPKGTQQPQELVMKTQMQRK
jgi:hypothetical protein